MIANNRCFKFGSRSSDLVDTIIIALGIFCIPYPRISLALGADLFVLVSISPNPSNSSFDVAFFPFCAWRREKYTHL